MKRDRLFRSVVLIIVCVLMTQHRTSAVPPNVLIVVADDQGWGDLSLHGNTNLSTPNIDALATAGAQFEHFYVCPVCSPTRAEMLTGRWHPRGGVRDVTSGGERLDLDETTIADVFRSAGYRTALFGKWHNGTQGPYHPLARGFDEFYGFTSGHWGHYFSPLIEQQDELTRGDGYLPDDLTNHAIDFMSRDDEKPFLTILTLNTPHSPMQVPDTWWDRVKERTIEKQSLTPDKEDQQFTRAAIAMCENIDWNVGRLMRTLDERHLADNTIVVYFSDNGPNSNRWNGGMRGQKGSVDEGGVRSPLFIRWPGKIAAGTKIGEIAGAVDLLPTLSELAGITPQQKKPLDGVSVAPLLSKPSSDWEDRILFSHWNGKVSARNQKYRLDEKSRLYDIENDLGQTKDVQTDHPDVHATLVAAVADYRKHVLSELSNSDSKFTREDHRAAVIADSKGNRTTLLPARDARISGGLVRSSRHPNCSFITNWASKDDAISWSVEIAEAGTFDVEVLYTCDANQVGSTIALQLESGNVVIPIPIATIDRPHESPLIGAAEDRVPRTESLVKDFGRKKLGTVELSPGIIGLSLKATSIAAEQVMDVRMLILKRQTE
ncbi:MAG TPA: arylsulfatase [Planctomycetaceae bacterium]|nr:arylsulfatase [Planctomycetaceae bacterium]